MRRRPPAPKSLPMARTGRRTPDGASRASQVRPGSDHALPRRGGAAPATIVWTRSEVISGPFEVTGDVEFLDADRERAGNSGGVASSPPPPPPARAWLHWG